MSVNEIETKDIYREMLKRFGEVAERVDRDEYFAAVEEISNIAEGKFLDIMSIIPLDDKSSFGDIDLVVIWDRPQDQSGEDYFKDVFGEKLVDYKHLKNDKMDSILLRLKSGKVAQVDFARTNDEMEFTAKIIHSSKGHSSSVIGTLAMAYGYKFAQDGFYKRYFDKQGQYHDILVTQDLLLGMEMLGLDPNKWIDASNVDDIIDFVSTSPFFDSKFFDRKRLKNKRRVAIEKRGVQNYMYSVLERRPKSRSSMDHEIYLKLNFPEYMDQVNESIELINKVTKTQEINGDEVMARFNIRPSKLVGEILLFIKLNFPEEKEITESVKTAVLDRFEL